MVGGSFSALPGGLQRIESPKIGRGGFGGTGRLQTDRSTCRRTPLSVIVADSGACEVKRYFSGGEPTGIRHHGAWHQYHCITTITDSHFKPGKVAATLLQVQQAGTPAIK